VKDIEGKFLNNKIHVANNVSPEKLCNLLSKCRKGIFSCLSIYKRNIHKKIRQTGKHEMGKKLKWLQLLNSPYSFCSNSENNVYVYFLSIHMQVSWYQNSFMLEPTDRRTMYSRGNKYILSIVNFRTTDFGNYRFVLFYCTNMFPNKHLLDNTLIIMELFPEFYLQASNFQFHIFSHCIYKISRVGKTLSVSTLKTRKCRTLIFF